MKSSGTFVEVIHHLKIAKEFLESFIREKPGTVGERMARQYVAKINWMYNDLITFPNFPDIVRQGIREEWEADPFTSMAINEKLAILNPAQREAIEAIIEEVLKGQEIIVESKKPENGKISQPDSGVH